MNLKYALTQQSQMELRMTQLLSKLDPILPELYWISQQMSKKWLCLWFRWTLMLFQAILHLNLIRIIIRVMPIQQKASHLNQTFNKFKTTHNLWRKKKSP